MHGLEHSIGVYRRNHGNELAFVCQIQRIEAEDFAEAANLGQDGYGPLVDLHTDASSYGWLLRRGRSLRLRPWPTSYARSRRLGPIMSDLPSVHRAAPESPLGYRSNEEWQDLLAQFAALAQAVEEIAHEETRARVTALLQATDAIHREALHRLVRLFKDGVLEQVTTDPAIHTLMSMYDLLPRSDPACRKVWDFIADPPAAAPTLKDVAPTGPEQPRWMLFQAHEPLAEGGAVVAVIDGRAIVCARIEGRYFAATAVCPAHRIAMTAGKLSGFSWICPAGPGCVYDIRDGSRLGGGRGLVCLPVRVSPESAEVRIGLGMPFTPQLPAF